MYCNIEKGKLKRVRRSSGVYENCEYRVPQGLDYRKGSWHFYTEILRPLRRQAWTLSIRNSCRFEGKHSKACIYLFRTSAYAIYDAYRQSMINGEDFDFFNTHTVQSAVNAKFSGSQDQIVAMLRHKFGPVVEAVVKDFLNTREYRCFREYIKLKLEVDAKIRALKEEDDKRAQDEKRRTEEYRRRCEEERRNWEDEQKRRLAEELAKPKNTRKSRVLKFAEEIAHKFARAAKMEFHPDRAKSGDGKADHEKSIIVGEVVNVAMPLLKKFVDAELEHGNAGDCHRDI